MAMKENLKKTFEAWKKQFPADYSRLDQQPWALQVRLERVEFDHIKYRYSIELSPIKFLYYFSIQARLWEPELADLRSVCFENALSFFIKNEPPVLPNHFALHMAIVSSDGQILIRQRPDEGITPLFPNVWEASIGEFMHGPDHFDFPHFTKEGIPDFGLFCVNAVAEETNYKEATPDQFRAYGFGIEYRTLAPKIFVVYQSDAPMATLLSQGTPSDQGKQLSSLELSPRGLAEAFSKDSGYLWSPSSRIISLIAMGNMTRKENDRKMMFAEFTRLFQKRA